jgi:hypothetical protein
MWVSHNAHYGKSSRFTLLIQETGLRKNYHKNKEIQLMATLMVMMAVIVAMLMGVLLLPMLVIVTIMTMTHRLMFMLMVMLLIGMATHFVFTSFIRAF